MFDSGPINWDAAESAAVATRKPVLLDLFCCQGGAGMGYQRAGFRVVGVDIQPQPRYPFEFIQADALAYLAEHGREYDAIHASPPCQAFTALRHMPTAREHPNLIPQTRALLQSSGRPYVIENVPGAPLDATLMLCGTMFGLQTPCGAELRRHRLFETSFVCLCGMSCDHASARTLAVTGGGSLVGGARVVSITGGHARDRAVGMKLRPSAGRVISVTGNSPSDPASDHRMRDQKARVITVTGHTAENPATNNKPRVISVVGSTAQQNTVHNKMRETFSVADARTAMGIDWMGMAGLSQAIPPAYTEFIGRQLMAVVRSERAHV